LLGFTEEGCTLDANPSSQRCHWSVSGNGHGYGG